ncbi:MAG: DUF116 domain-containing protein [Desulfovibrio sp.]|nr:DUF116 domain-containing protein [Desulfovibrio sp.]
MLRKSPFSLPPEQYGGARKRIFIGLMLASCLLLCLVAGVFFVLPWSGLIRPGTWRPAVSITVGAVCMLALLWLCLTLVFHIYTGKPLPGVSSVRHLTIRLFFPLMELLAKAVGIERGKLRRSFIKVNNELVLADHRPVEPSSLLLLLPHCVQRSACPHRLVHNADNCRRCGACPVGSLLALRDKYGIRLAVATGGTLARRIVVQTRPRCIIAVACERDLTSGIQDSYPIPVFGVLNMRPHGPCIDTLVPLQALENAIRLFLGLCRSSGEVC